MKELIGIAVVVLMSSSASPAQKGTAETGYYPMNYTGDTWTGEVTSVNEDTRELTLTFKKKDKDETFVVVLPKGYSHKMADGTEREVKLTDLMGMRLKVYYVAKSKKVDDQKVRFYEVFKIKIVSLK